MSFFRWAIVVSLAVVSLFSCAEDEMGRPAERDPDELTRLLDLPGKAPSQMGAGVAIDPGQSRTIIKNTGSDDHDIRLVTIYLRASRLGVATSTVPPLDARIVFRVLFGVGGGANQELLVSAKQGVAVTFTASSVEVSARNDEDPGLGAPSVMATAALSYGPRAPTGSYDPASLDERRVVLPGGAQEQFSPPPFARAVTVTIDAGVGGDTSTSELLFTGGQPAATLARVTGQVGEQFFDSVPLPDTANSMTVTNTGVGVVTYNVSWLLGI